MASGTLGLGAMEAMMEMTAAGPLGSRAFSPIPGPGGTQGWYKGGRCGPRNTFPRAEPTLSTGPWLTLQEAGKGLGARGGDGQRQLVHSHTVSHGQGVDFSVGDLPGQQLPEQNPEAAGGEREGDAAAHPSPHLHPSPALLLLQLLGPQESGLTSTGLFFRLEDGVGS